MWRKRRKFARPAADSDVRKWYRMLSFLWLMATSSAAPPGVVKGTCSISQVRFVDSGATQVFNALQALYTVARCEVAFDQPLYINGELLSSIPVEAKSRELQGLTRLHCGKMLIDSHPQDSEEALLSNPTTRKQSDFADMLIPFMHPSVKQGGLKTTTVLEPDNPNQDSVYRSSLVFSPAKTKSGVTSVFLRDLSEGRCSLRFLGIDEQDWEPFVNLTNKNGEMFVQDVPLQRVAAADQMNDNHGPYHAIMHHSARGVKDLDPMSEHFVSLIETVENLHNTEELEVGQIEVLAEPIVHVAIPIVISVIMSIIRLLIIMIIGMIMAPLFINPIVEPVMEALLPPPTTPADGIGTPYEGSAGISSPIAGGNPNHPESMDPSLPNAGMKFPANANPLLNPEGFQAGGKTKLGSNWPKGRWKKLPDKQAAPSPLKAPATAKEAKLLKRDVGAAVVRAKVRDRLRAQKSILQLWNLYAHGSVESKKGQEGTITKPEIIKTLNTFLTKAAAKVGVTGTTKEVKGQPRPGGIRAKEQHWKIRDCLRKNIPQAADDIVKALDTNGKPGVQWGEWSRDWEFDAPLRRPFPANAYHMHNIVHDMIQKCRRRAARISPKDIDNLFMKYDLDKSRTLTLPEIKEAFESIIMERLKRLATQRSNVAPEALPRGKPGQPTMTKIEAGDGRVYVTLKPPELDGGTPLVKYTVCAEPGNKCIASRTADVPITLKGLTNGTPYIITALVSNAAGFISPPSSRSAPVVPKKGLNSYDTTMELTAPSPPSIVSVTPLDGKVVIKIKASDSNGGSPIRLYTATSVPGGYQGQTISAATPITVSSLTNGMDYKFFVTARNAAGFKSAPSATTSKFATPYFPGALTVDGVNSLRVCSRKRIPVMAQAALKRVDLGGEPGIQIQEFRSDPWAFREIASVMMARCKRTTKAKITADFNNCDQNGDGQITEPELRLCLKEKIRKRVPADLGGLLPATGGNPNDSNKVRGQIGDAVGKVVKSVMNGQPSLSKAEFEERGRELTRSARLIKKEAAAELKTMAKEDKDAAAGLSAELKADEKRTADNEAHDKEVEQKGEKEAKMKLMAERKTKEETRKEAERKQKEEAKRKGKHEDKRKDSLERDLKAESSALHQMTSIEREFHYFDNNHNTFLDRKELRHGLTLITYQHIACLRRKNKFTHEDKSHHGELVAVDKSWECAHDPRVHETANEVRLRHLRIKECVQEGAADITPAVMTDLKATKKGVSLKHYESVKYEEVIVTLAREVAFSCTHQAMSDLESLWHFYHSECVRYRKGSSLKVHHKRMKTVNSIFVDELESVLFLMLDYSSSVSRAEWRELKSCLEPRIHTLATTIFQKYKLTGTSPLTKKVFMKHPHIILREAQKLTRECNEGIFGQYVRTYAPNYDTSFMRVIWHLTVRRPDSLAATMSLADLRKAMKLLLESKHVTHQSSTHVSNVIACVEKNVPVYSTHLMKRFDRNRKPGLQWYEFRRAGHVLMHHLEEMAFQCHHNQTSTKITDQHRFSEVFKGRSAVTESLEQAGRWKAIFVPSFDPRFDRDVVSHRFPYGYRSRHRDSNLDASEAKDREHLADALVQVHSEVGLSISASDYHRLRSKHYSFLDSDDTELSSTWSRESVNQRASIMGNLRLLTAENAKEYARTHTQSGVSALAEAHGLTAIPQDLKPPSTSGVMGDRIGSSVTDSAQEFLVHSLGMSLEANLRHNVNQTVGRKLTRKLTKTLTASLTDSLVLMILRKVSDPYVHTATRILNHALVPSLTQSLTATISRSMSRHPQEDYFCYYCKTKEVYCQYCQDSATNDHDSDYYRSSYAQFYSNYFGTFYSTDVDIAAVMKDSHPYVNKSQEDRGDPFVPGAAQAESGPSDIAAPTDPSAGGQQPAGQQPAGQTAPTIPAGI